MMKGVHFQLSIVATLALATFLVSASDPSPLQDFCVAINNTESAGMYMHMHMHALHYFHIVIRIN